MALSFALPYLGYSFKLDSPNATILIGLYTFILHMLFGFYNLDVYRGSSSDWVPSPIFELSVDTMNSVAIILAIYSFLYMFIASLGLIHGVQTVSRVKN